MSRCVECMSPVSRVINPETRTVERCPVCNESVDMYFEFGDMQKWIDIALLQKRAWVHTIYNEGNASVNYDGNVTLRYMMFAIFCCGLEAFVARSFHVRSAYAISSNNVGGMEGDASFSLRIVRILLNPPLLAAMKYHTAVPQLMFYAAVEYLLLVAVAGWLGSNLRPKDARYEEVLGQWVRAVSLASSVKVVFCIFLIWNVPVALLPVVDGLFCVWLARSIFVLTFEQALLVSVPSVLLCIGTRLFFRYMTQWNGILLYS